MALHVEGRSDACRGSDGDGAVGVAKVSWCQGLTDASTPAGYDFRLADGVVTESGRVRRQVGGR